MKHVLIAVYIFSILYCYAQLTNLMERCIAEFQSRHPLIPMDEPAWTSSFKVGLEMIAISAVPVINLFLGFSVSAMGDSVVSEIVTNVESNNWKEIQEAEDFQERKNELDKYF